MGSRAVTEIPVRLPDVALPSADWADCFEVNVKGYAGDARSAAQTMVDGLPAWAVFLMKLRNILVRPFGLVTDASTIECRPEMIGLFPVIRDSGNEIILGLDDSHLDFRLTVRTTASHVRVVTLVKRNNRLGQIYLAAIMPFHKLILHALTRHLTRSAPDSQS